MSLGFEQAGFDIVFAVDNDAHHVATHQRNFPYCKTIMESITELSVKSILSHIGSSREADLVFGGPPCQGFSNMGLRDTGDPRNTLVGEFIRIVKEISPKAFVMENVPGMNSGDTAPIFDWAVENFTKLGYRLASPIRTLNSADFGVPQIRKRLFLIGIREDIDYTPRYPEGPSRCQPPRPTVWDAIADLPKVEDDDSLLVSDISKYSVEPAKENKYARVARGFEKNGSDFGRPREWNDKLVSGCLRTRHSEKTRDLYASTPPGQMVPGHKLPKLDPYGLAPTLRAGTNSARGSFTAPRPVHPKQPRVITAREAARLHGYPDWFSFYPAKWHALRQIGNSVCPPVAMAVGAELIVALGYKQKDLLRPRVKLSDEFNLPDEAERTQKRIPFANEFPKIVNWLFEIKYDAKKRSMKDPTISVEDIYHAIESTGVSLPRVRPERFLVETSRYRSVEKLLRLPMSKGFTIAIVDREAGTGEFVPIGSPDTIEDKDSIKVPSAEINMATPVDIDQTLLDTEAGALTISENLNVLESLPNGMLTELKLDRDLFGIGNSVPVQADIRVDNKRRLRGIVLSSLNGRLPKKSQIERQLVNAHLKHAVLVACLTKKHFMLAFFERNRGKAEMLWRHFFVVRPKNEV